MFRVWAPHALRVSVRGGDADTPLEDVGFGVHEGSARLHPGDDYLFVLHRDAGDAGEAGGAGESGDARDAIDAGGGEGRARAVELALPDPCSRHQPHGLRGPSRVLDTGAFAWTDEQWQTPAADDLVLYELHVGTFTAEGTFDAAAAHLTALAELGVNAVELMPVADFPGEHGWGYDGVYISAAHRAYGGPHGLARFVDAAHAAGVAVLLDVVYNHVGASGAGAMEAFGPYFTDSYGTFWGRAINYDGPDSDPVREWVAQSAVSWIRDFHLDGLRLDAIHAIFDASPRHIVAEVAARVHEVAPHALVIAESGLNDAKVIRPPARGGWACDAQWSDDFHHSLHVLLTGERDGYYCDFGTVADLAKAFVRPVVYDGEYSPFRRRSFGAPAGDCPPERFVVFNANHDQVGNRAYGDRLPQGVRALAAFCTLLSPFTPMLFMGEEYGEPAPFRFFTDHIDEQIARATRDGRLREFAQFAAFGQDVPDPQDPSTFLASKLTRAVDEPLAALYRDLLRARRDLRGEAQVSFDEDARWLRVRRDGGELLCNFAATPHAFEVPAGARVLLATHPPHAVAGAAGHGISLRVGPMAGALIA